MLDEYIEEQKIAYKVLKNAVMKDKCSHAYLFETNGYIKKEEFALAFAKYVLCPNKYSNNQKCVNCTQCDNIDKNIFSEIKIISPDKDSLWIKKEQLVELQNEFKTKSLLANKKIYIITDATKLNTSSANSILKFLEEPADNIIAILLADNIHQLLDTIVSRCQIVSLVNKKTKENLLESLISVKLDNIEEIKENTINYINELEKNKKEMILFNKKYFHNYIKEKNELIASFEIMILYYKEAINLKLNLDNEIIDNVNNILLNNTIEELNKKIKIITDLKKNIYVNANINLLLDKLVIELGGV